MDNKIYLSLCFSLISIACFSQKINSRNSITYISIANNTLIQNINLLVNREIASPDTSNLFKKGFGYVQLSIISYHDHDTLIKYYINPELGFLKADSPDSLYPNYYSYVDNTLVIIYDDMLNEISNDRFVEKDKKKIRKLIDQHLQKPQRKTFYDLNGKKAFTDGAFRIDYLKLHNGIYLYILKDKPPVVVTE